MNARERFKRTKQAVKRFNAVHLLLMNDGEDWRPAEIKTRSDKSDPTARVAIYNVDERADYLEALRDEEAELLEFIGTSLAIIEAVRAGFGEEYANLLEARYVDCWKWNHIKDEYDITRHEGRYKLGIVFDWIDSVGVSRLLAGNVEV